MKMEGYVGEFLSPEDILKLHDDIINDSEVNDAKGFIDINGKLFDGAVKSIFASFGGQDLCPTIEEKAAKLCYNIITEHVFLNANKRTAMMAMLMLLDMNGKNSKFNQDELYDIINGIGNNVVSYEDLLYFIAPNLKEKNENNITP